MVQNTRVFTANVAATMAAKLPDGADTRQSWIRAETKQDRLQSFLDNAFKGLELTLRSTDAERLATVPTQLALIREVLRRADKLGVKLQLPEGHQDQTAQAESLARLKEAAPDPIKTAPVA